MAPALKFLHTADLHLDRVIEGLAEIPAHLKGTLANAAFRAAEHVFALALAERVDFVLIAGDLIEIDLGGPRAFTFLQTQFQRLADKQIPVFWASGSVDPLDRWPAAAALPANVTLLSSSYMERHVVSKQGKPVATIFGAGYYPGRDALTELRVATDDLFPIVLAHQPPGELPETLPVRYWALGGSHAGRIQERGGSTVVQPGTPQARTPQETGRHTCALVHVDAAGRIRVESTATDVVRWLPQTLSVAESASDDEIRNLLADRALQISADIPEQLGLVAWSLETSGEIAPRLRTAAWRDGMLRWLRTEFGATEKGVWSVDLQLEGSRPLPRGWYEEDTMLGDYLQALGRYQADAEIPINLHAYLPTALGDERLASLARVEGTRRNEVLQQAAFVGVERLGGWSDEDQGDVR